MEGREICKTICIVKCIGCKFNKIPGCGKEKKRLEQKIKKEF